ncbi:glucose 1-dehydrogenase [Planctobacterium marinum]|uniref:Oxidoreductase n=1 Tax=Planctobacterium marinum TaxID=1631968 RepID=A0AA48HI77_9ALTE|nr:oxidoreductase [Planctobacterium marinum]
MAQNKVVLITGSSRGIGAQTAQRFAQAGYAVVLNYRQAKKEAEELQQQIQAIGVECCAVQADVTKESDVSELFAQADNLGRLSVLVNNAGILKQQARVADISAERFMQVMEVNILSCLLCTQQAIKRMSTEQGGAGGAIVNVSSLAAKTGSPNEYVDYAASKGAMDSFTRGAALELAEEGIRVNAVRPGLIYTDIHASGGEPDRVNRLKHKLPLQRGGEPEEVAEAIYWLASEQSSYTTGTLLDVAGGL